MINQDMLRKFLIVLFGIGCIQHGYGQSDILLRKVTISFENQSVKEALNKLKKQENCFLIYADDEISNRIVNQKFEKALLGEIVKKIWGKSNMTLKASGNTIRIISVQTGNLKGRVTDENGNPVPFASVFLQNTTYGAQTDGNGNFSFSAPPGEYSLAISMLGYRDGSKKILVTENGRLNVSITISSFDEELREVVVIGKTEAKTISEEAITISSLDTKKFQDQALGTEEVLKTTTGLVVRQSGGLGSPVSINLNGFSGNAVRTYYDGIPMEVYGNALRLNTIPIDALERVDVYKGVMPIDVGTDALGGGLNLVPVNQSDDYLRTSYSVGSFNTHRITFNGLKNLSSRTSLSTISYLNYSDNDYEMRDIPSLIEIELPDGSPGFEEERINARRFHDQHISGFIEGKLRIKELKWADRLELAVVYSKTADEIHNAGAIRNTAIGEVEREIDVFSQRVDYRKNFFKDKISARYFGVLSHTVDKINDSTNNMYNWRRQILDITNPFGAEISGAPSLLQRENLGTAHRLKLTYNITRHIYVKVTDYYRYTRQKGEDPLGERIAIDGELTDPNSLPSTLNRNIFGAELNANFFEDKLSTITFFKNYFYQAESVDIFRLGGSQLEFSEIQNNSNGYGFALKYQLHPTVFIRTSVEQAIRIPTETEIFGDLAAIIPNFDLEPEESLNWNVGAQFEKRFKNDRSILLNVSGFIRNRENLIRPRFFFDRIEFINEAVVDGKGIELAVKISPLKNLSLQGNFTSQSNEIAAGIDIGSEVPNIPLTFYNVGANYRIEDLFKPGNSLQLSWTYLFVDRFSINTVQDLNTANPDFIVPKQHVHNAGVSYKLKPQGLAFSFNLQNVFNAEIFDNFRIPRPGINYAFKINYSF